MKIITVEECTEGYLIREIGTDRVFAVTNQQVAKKEAAQGLIAETIEADEYEDVNKTQEEP